MSLMLVPATMRKRNEKVAAACAIARAEKQRLRKFEGLKARFVAPAPDPDPAITVALPAPVYDPTHRPTLQIGAGTLRKTIYQCAQHRQWFEMNLISNPRMFAYQKICIGFEPDAGWTVPCDILVKKSMQGAAYPPGDKIKHHERQFLIDAEGGSDLRARKTKYRDTLNYYEQLVAAGATGEEAREVLKKRIFQDWPELQDHDIREFVLPRPA